MTCPHHDPSLRHLAVAIAASLLAHALLLAGGPRVVPVATLPFAPADRHNESVLSVAMQAVLVPRVSEAPAIPAERGTDASEGSGREKARGGVALPLAPPAPPQIAETPQTLRVSVVPDDDPSPDARFLDLLAREFPNAERGALTFDVPLSVDYPLQRLGEQGLRQNRALIVAQPDGTATLAMAEHDDGAFVDALRRALEGNRASSPGFADGDGRPRWALFVFWLERAAADTPPEPRPLNP